MNEEDKINETINDGEFEEETSKDAKESALIGDLKSEIQQLKSEVTNWQNKYYGAYADLDNQRKMYQSDYQKQIKYRAEGFVDKLLPVLETFQMALQLENVPDELKSYLIGFESVKNQIVSSLASEGISEIKPDIGDAFDSELHHALDVEECKPGKEDRIAKVYSNGYRLHDKILRHASVRVTVRKRN